MNFDHLGHRITIPQTFSTCPRFWGHQADKANGPDLALVMKGAILVEIGPAGVVTRRELATRHFSFCRARKKNRCGGSPAAVYAKDGEQTLTQISRR